MAAPVLRAYRTTGCKRKPKERDSDQSKNQATSPKWSRFVSREPSFSPIKRPIEYGYCYAQEARNCKQRCLRRGRSEIGTLSVMAVGVIRLRYGDFSTRILSKRPDIAILASQGRSTSSAPTCGLGLALATTYLQPYTPHPLSTRLSTLPRRHQLCRSWVLA